MNHGSLFSGIGGFDLAAEWAGWTNIFHCEKEDFQRRVLKKHWPNVKSYEDIKQTDFTIHRGTVDIITGGFPCQPFSHAGKRKGIEDGRNLWPEMLRVIKEVRPSFFIGENVAGLKSMENSTPFEKWIFFGMEGRSYIRRIYSRYIYRKRQTFVLNKIIESVEKEGYTVETFNIPACGVGAWHRRERLWIVGYSKHNGSHDAERRGNDKEPPVTSGSNEVWEPSRTDSMQSSDVANANDVLHKGRLGHGRSGAEATGNKKTDQHEGETSHGERVWTESGAGSENATNTDSQRRRGRITDRENAKNAWELRRGQEHGLWDAEPNVGRVANGIPNRVDRLKSLGNAIVPQVAYEIFKAIDAIHNE